MSLEAPAIAARSYRVLFVHARYLIRGGEDECVDAEMAMLKAAGHEVELHEAFNQDLLTWRDKWGGARNAIWNRSAVAELGTRLAGRRFDVAHVHNVFPALSPAVLHALNRAAVPIVQSIHNYRLLCASANLFRDGLPCEECCGRAFGWPAIKHRCYRRSASASAVVSTMTAIHSQLGTWRQVERFVAVSDYVRRKAIQSGLPAERVVVKPNFVEVVPSPSAVARKNVLYVGRITPDKGVDLLVGAWCAKPRNCDLLLVGEGDAGFAWGSRQSARVVHLGRQPLPRVYDLIAQAALLVLPARWPEPFGRVVIEAFAHGTPVLTSDAGGLPELVEDGVTGRLFRTGSVEDLTQKLDELLKDPDVLAAMGRTARGVFLRRYGQDENLRQLTAVYRAAIKDHHARQAARVPARSG